MQTSKVFIASAAEHLSNKLIEELNISSKKINSKNEFKLGKHSIQRYSDGEIDIEIEIDDTISSNPIILIQSLSFPINDNLMELLLFIDALKSAEAKNIILLIPYIAYARGDKLKKNKSCAAKVLGNLLNHEEIKKIITIDIHSQESLNLIKKPIINLLPCKEFANHISRQNYSNPIIGSPDEGGIERGKRLAEELKLPFAYLEKTRDSSNIASITKIHGNVKNKTCIIYDDIVDTAGTLIKAAEYIKENGASKIIACCTHPVLSNNAEQKIEHSCIEQLITTDTIKPNNKQTSKIITISNIDNIVKELLSN